ncbi:fatty acid desaturase family protein [Laspinema olomoucense]|uniref:fatty acid desaturase family protein n=1 Tax=Laspinema olomoucense TaxID=3231600 RepID=UPI0021BB9F39|nr:fatty acid desaturase [Laspinema sp. D3c]
MSDRLLQSHSLTQSLQQVTADLQSIDPVPGLLRFTILGFLSLSLLLIAWTTANPIFFATTATLGGFLWGFWLICTHDMTHQTLTGWKNCDRLLPYVISWPLFWPYGVYATLHPWHHAWNGINLRDPERVQWTEVEYQQAHPLVQFYIRHQWAIDIAIFGGIGLIFKTLVKGLQFQEQIPRLRQQLIRDILGSVSIHTLLFTGAYLQGKVLHYLLLWLILERAIGLVMQTRDHLEHYGLWGKSTTSHLTQLYGGRNIATHPLIGWLMGGLSYHAIHHAFPGIPFYHLPEACDRIQTVLQDHELPPMKLDPGYLKSAYHLGKNPVLIGASDDTTTNRAIST